MFENHIQLSGQNVRGKYPWNPELSADKGTVKQSMVVASYKESETQHLLRIWMDVCSSSDIKH